MGLGARLFFKNAPDRIIQGVQIRRVWRPLSNLSLWADVHFDEVLRESAEPLLPCAEEAIVAATLLAAANANSCS